MALLRRLQLLAGEWDARQLQLEDVLVIGPRVVHHNCLQLRQSEERGHDVGLVGAIDVNQNHGHLPVLCGRDDLGADVARPVTLRAPACGQGAVQGEEGLVQCVGDSLRVHVVALESAPENRRTVRVQDAVLEKLPLLVGDAVPLQGERLLEVVRVAGVLVQDPVLQPRFVQPVRRGEGVHQAPGGHFRQQLVGDPAVGGALQYARPPLRGHVVPARKAQFPGDAVVPVLVPLQFLRLGVLVVEVQRVLVDVLERDRGDWAGGARW